MDTCKDQKTKCLSAERYKMATFGIFLYVCYEVIQGQYFNAISVGVNGQCLGVFWTVC